MKIGIHFIPASLTHLISTSTVLEVLLGYKVFKVANRKSQIASYLSCFLR